MLFLHTPWCHLSIFFSVYLFSFSLSLVANPLFLLPSILSKSGSVSSLSLFSLFYCPYEVYQYSYSSFRVQQKLVRQFPPIFFLAIGTFKISETLKGNFSTSVMTITTWLYEHWRVVDINYLNKKTEMTPFQIIQFNRKR